MRTVLLALAIAAALTAACGDESASSSRRSGSATPPPTAQGQFSLWLSATRVPPEPVELVAVLVNNAGTEATFGVAANVDRWNGQDWAPHGRLAMCMDHWHCTAKVQSSDGDLAVPAIGLSASRGRPGPVERFTTAGLTTGWWRISQQANEGVVAAGFLEVADGAARPAPLSPTDVPSISVTPVLVPAQGGPITLFPLVPAKDGTQSLSDVEEAVAGLAETATVEQWHEGRWNHVADITLAVQPEGAGLERTADLPPLQPGEYRIVRAGNDQPHTGRLWVTEDAS